VCCGDGICYVGSRKKNNAHNTQRLLVEVNIAGFTTDIFVGKTMMMTCFVIYYSNL
jgi:hypothetical protein